jgi:hypothetical protein
LLPGFSVPPISLTRQLFAAQLAASILPHSAS